MNGFGPTPNGERRIQLARDPASAGEQRHLVNTLLLGSDASENARASGQLVASELVTNALQHGEGAIELRLSLIGEFLRIEVVDQGRDQAPAVRQAEGDETGGWGLR